MHIDPGVSSERARPQGVLLVEDDPLLRRCVTRMLEHLGRRVLCACDGVEALEIFSARSGEIDVVILDLSMPRIDGPAALARLRALDPRVPVILSSGHLDSRLEALDIAGDVQGVLPKPYTTKQMLEVLQAV